MARKKVNLAWISNDSTRKATFKKRKRGLMKKASELATLCDVKTCVVVYGPQEANPEVWPSLPEAARVLARFKSMPEMEQCKKMMNQEGFFRQRAGKIQEQLRKQERENRELETTLLMYEGLARRSLHDVGIEEATSLAWMVEMKAKAVHERIEMIKAQMASAHAAGEMAMQGGGHGFVDVGGAGAVVVKEKSPLEVAIAMEALQRQGNWFMDMNNTCDNMMYDGGNSSVGVDGIVQPYMENANPWLDSFFFPPRGPMC